MTRKKYFPHKQICSYDKKHFFPEEYIIMAPEDMFYENSSDEEESSRSSVQPEEGKSLIEDFEE